MSAKKPRKVLAPRRIPRERLDLVEKLWLAGKTDRQISRLVSKRFGVTLRQGRRYILRVRQSLAKRQIEQVNPDSARARAISLLLETYAVAKSKGGMSGPDTKTMAVVAARLAELEGAFAPKELKHTVSGAIPLAGLSDETLAELDAAANLRSAK